MSHSAQLIGSIPNLGHHQLECIGCGERGAEAALDFRCEKCGDLLEAVWRYCPHAGLAPLLRLATKHQRPLGAFSLLVVGFVLLA